MDRWDFLKWRRTLHLTQAEAGQELGVHRATIVNWEGGSTPIPKIVQLACSEITRRSKQRADFGPVVLIYLENCGQNVLGFSDPMVAFRCSRYATNNAAIEAAQSLFEMKNGARPIFIVDPGGDLIWNAQELLRAYEERAKKITQQN